jgi:hypothetical protein
MDSSGARLQARWRARTGRLRGRGAGAGGQSGTFEVVGVVVEGEDGFLRVLRAARFRDVGDVRREGGAGFWLLDRVRVGWDCFRACCWWWRGL